MAKNIKKSVKYLIIIAGLIILIPLLAYSILNLPKVQTAIVNRYTRHISEDLGASISIGEVELRFFNRIRLRNIVVQGAINDTIVQIDEATINIRKIEPARNNYVIGRILIEKPTVNLYTDSSGNFNIMYILEKIKNNENGNKKNKNNTTINKVDIVNGECDIKLIGSKQPDSMNTIALSTINGSINDISITDSLVLLTFSSLSFVESSGFSLSSLQSSASITGKEIILSSTSIKSDNSEIKLARLSFLGDTTTGFREFKDNVEINLEVEQSYLNSNDIAYFFGQAGRINESISFSGKIYGTLAELRGRDIVASFRDYTKLDADIDISGLPDLSNSYIYLGVNQLTTDASDFEKILVDGQKNLTIPDVVVNLGRTTIKGSYTGFVTDFVAYGRIISDQGIIDTDISVKPLGSDSIVITGLVEGRNIVLGKLTGYTEFLGNVSLSAEIDGVASRYDNYSGSLSGTIDSIEVNDYLYRDIGFNGSFDENKWDGHITASEENIEFDLLGMLNFDKQMPQFDFTFDLGRSNLFALNIDKSDTVSTLSMLLTANFEGNNIDNLVGEVLLHNANLGRNDKTLNINSFSLSSQLKDTIHTLSLITDFIDAEVAGNYSSSDLTSIIKNLLASLFPSIFGNDYSLINLTSNYLTFNINFKNTDRINNFFETGYSLAEDSRIKGNFIQDSIFNIEGSSGYLGYRNFIFQNLEFIADIQSGEMDITFNSESLNFPWKYSMNDISLDFKTKPDTFNIDLNWDDGRQLTGKDRITATGKLSSFSGQINPIVNIDIQPTVLYNNDRAWELGESAIVIDTTSISFDNFNIKSHNKYFNLDGTLSENKFDTLRFDFNGIDLSPINNIANKNLQINASYLAINLEGIISGNILMTDIYNSPLLESNIQINDFSIYDSDYGDLHLESGWNNINRKLEVKGKNNLMGTTMLDVDGYYDPEDSYFDIDFFASHLPVTVLNTLLKSFASDIYGTTSGKLNLSGYPKKLTLEGSLFTENANMRINLLNTNYSINDSIYFKKDGIYFQNTNVLDERENPGSITGVVYHDYFKNFRADLLINANNSMVLNTRAKDNEYVYGNVYATGVTTIKSGQSTLSIDVSATTERNTRVYIPLIYNEVVADNSFISFVNSDTTGLNRLPSGGEQSPQKNIASNVNIDMTVTPDAEIQLIFDSKLGDIIETTGSGNLNINYDSEGELKITGDYSIDQGNYLFTLGNLLNKSFNLEDGGTITFNGNIEETEINIKGIYSVRASLFDILQDDRFNDRIPVECQLTLTGNLMNPAIQIGIYLPNANEETRSYLNSVISTDDELSRQFVSLLVMNSFYASSSNPTTSGSSALSVTTSEMLLNQIGNWLSQISNDFDIGFLYSPGFNNDINSQEFQVALSTQILDNRVTINSDLGYRGANATSSGNEQITGDFDIEYKITERIRFKVFNRFNNPYQGRQADYTQGVGIFYRQEFNKFADIFRSKKNSEAIKEEEPTVDNEL
jgi:hypothetical protein